jgi:hypothetical protein
VKLKKALYECQEASYEFYRHLKRILLNYGLKLSRYDNGLFYKSIDLIVLTHVDDLLASEKLRNSIISNDIWKSALTKLRSTTNPNFIQYYKEELKLNLKTAKQMHDAFFSFSFKGLSFLVSKSLTYCCVERFNEYEYLKLKLIIGILNSNSNRKRPTLL